MRSREDQRGSGPVRYGTARRRTWPCTEESVSTDKLTTSHSDSDISNRNLHWSRRPHHAVDGALPVVEDRLLPHIRPRLRRVDHHAVADVEAHVADVVVEEDEVAGAGGGE